MRKKNKLRKNKDLINLIILIIFTQIIVMSAARYISSTYGKDVIKIATFIADSDIHESIQKIELTDLYPGCEEKVFNFEISNNSEKGISEVTSGYSFSIRSMGNIPLTFKIELDQENSTDAGSTAVQKYKGSEIIWDGGILPNSINTTHTYKVTVSWDESENDVKYSEEIDMLEIKVNSEQID